MEKLKKLFAEFINGLSKFELEGFCASKLDINWDGEGFFVVQYGDSSGVKVFDSDGQADAPISVSKMKKFLISNSENFLQGVFYG